MENLIFFLIGAGALAGGLDVVLNNKMGLGKSFTQGIQALGPLTLGMTGIICLSPLIAGALRPIFYLYQVVFHLDPAILCSVLACDMGGYTLAREIAHDVQMGSYAGMIIASMLGCTLSFLIPVGLNLVGKENLPLFFKGIMFGITGIFGGAMVGGLLAGYPFKMVFQNTMPVLFISGMLVIGLANYPDTVILGCRIFGKGIYACSIGGLSLAGFQMITGKTILASMVPVEGTMITIGKIGVFLMGALPIMEIINRLFKRVAGLMGRTESVAGLTAYLFVLVNPLPILMKYANLSEREKIRLTAFMVCASCALGDHMGFATGVEPKLTLPLFTGKVIGGILALFVEWAFRRIFKLKINLAGKPSTR